MLVQKALKPREKQVSNMLGPSNSINTRCNGFPYTIQPPNLTPELVFLS